MALQPFEPWQFFQYLNLYTVCRTPWTGDHSIARPLPTHRTTQAENKHTQASIPWVEFEITTPVFERTKMVHVKIRKIFKVKNRHIDYEQLPASEGLSKMDFVSQLGILHIEKIRRTRYIKWVKMDGRRYYGTVNLLGEKWDRRGYKNSVSIRHKYLTREGGMKKEK
jgi:hypothetical protein